MNVLILGGGFDNKGAEAMLVTLTRHLRDTLPNVAVFHPTNRADAWERKQLRAHGIATVPGAQYVSATIRVPEYLKSRLLTGIRAGSNIADASWRNIDAVLDISGFASGDQWGAEAARDRWWEIHRLKSLGIPVVFLPQAWGPFRQRAVRRYTSAMLRRVPLVFARDRQSFEFLIGLNGLSPSALARAADVAFGFSPSSPDVGAALIRSAGIFRTDRPLIAVVPNSQVYRRCAGESTDNLYVRALANVCRHLIEEAEADCLILPHTRAGEGRVDDVEIGRMVARTGDFGDRLALLEGHWTAADLKAAIGCVDMLVGSRFHAIIAACSMRVPVVAIGWSHKYRELLNDAGLGEYVCGAEDIDARAVELVRRAWVSREAMRRSLEEHVPALEASSLEALKRATETIMSWRTTVRRPRPLRPAAGADVREVVAAGLCVGCGQCVSACPEDAVSLTETPAGALHAGVYPERCVSCGLCMRICPGWHLESGLLPADNDPFTGTILGAYVCRATDEALLKDAQSGGVVTALLCDMLTRGEIDGAVVTQMPDDGGLRPRCVVACTEEDVLAARGSKYCTAAPNAVSLNGKSRVAFVGVGCQVQGLRNAQKAGCVSNIRLVVGLFCDRNYSLAFGDYLSERARVPRAEVAGIRYRSKRLRGWPGDVCVLTSAGEERMLSRDERVRAKDAFTLPRCYLCFDKLNVLSDIAVGDAHGLSNDRRGSSLVLVRTERGAEALERALQRGLLEASPVSKEQASDKSQQVEQRRHRWAACTHLAGTLGQAVPDVPIAPQWYPGGLLQLHTYEKPYRWSLKLVCLGSTCEVLRSARRYIRSESIRKTLAPVGFRAWTRNARRLWRLAKRIKRHLRVQR